MSLNTRRVITNYYHFFQALDSTTPSSLTCIGQHKKAVKAICVSIYLLHILFLYYFSWFGGIFLDYLFLFFFNCMARDFLTNLSSLFLSLSLSLPLSFPLSFPLWNLRPIFSLKNDVRPTSWMTPKPREIRGKSKQLY